VRILENHNRAFSLEEMSIGIDEARIYLTGLHWTCRGSAGQIISRILAHLRVSLHKFTITVNTLPPVMKKFVDLCVTEMYQT
jgi:hypothetical protein